MRVAVTGSSGRIGRVTTDALTAAGHSVVAIDRVPPPPDAGAAVAESIRLSMDDYPAVLAAFRGADAIVHLAAIPTPRTDPPHVVHNDNVVGSWNALCAAMELGIPRVLMASSVNAIGAAWSRRPVFDYFPVDELHRTRNEDAYSLSKWIGEQQADSAARLDDRLSIASFRIHMFVDDRAEALRLSAANAPEVVRGLWGYTTRRAWADACTRALTAEFSGHRVLWVVAGETASAVDSMTLARTHYPDVEVRTPLVGHQGFFDTSATSQQLGWSGAD